jgi:hypothetical protein
MLTYRTALLRLWKREADVTLHISENVSLWLMDGSLVTIVGDMLPPRDPDDDDDEDEENEEGDHEDEEQAVIREPDE